MNLRSSAKPDPTKLYVAITSFSWHETLPVVREGDRLLGDHPAVAKAFALFVPDGTPSNQIAEAQVALRDRALAGAK